MKKFLTVLLALSVVFTYTVGTAFAVTDQETANAKVVEVQNAAEKALNDYAATIVYNQQNKLVTPTVDANLTKAAVEAGVAKAIADKKTEIQNKAIVYMQDDKWTESESTALEKLGKIDSEAAYKLIFVTNKATVYGKAIADAKAEVVAAMNAVSEAAYSKADAEYIAKAKTDAQATLDGVTEAKYNATGLQTVLEAKGDFEAAVKTKKTVAEQETELAKAKTDAKADLAKAADALKTKATTAYENIINGATSTAAQIATATAKLASLDADIAKVVAFYEAEIDAPALDLDGNPAVTLADAKGAVESALTAGKAALANTTALDNKVAELASSDLLVQYAKNYAEAMKNQFSKETGLPVYNSATVDKALDAIVAKINKLDSSVNTYAKIEVELKKTPTAADEAKNLKNAKESAIKEITSNPYIADLWTEANQDAVKAIQDEYTNKINAASSTDEIDAAVKEAKEKMNALLTKAIAAKQEATANSYANSKYAAKLLDYANGVAAKNPGAYSSDTITAIVADALEVFADAVLAQNNPKLTTAEIKAIVDANYNNALAVIDGMKTDAELNAAANAVVEAIKALPTVPTLENKAPYLAAQKMLEDYDAIPGSISSKVTNRSLLAAYMSRIIVMEKAAVEEQIKALPKNPTVADEAAVKAVRDAVDAYEKAYSKYANVSATQDAPMYPYGYTAVDTRALENAETAVSNAKLTEAAKKVAALPATITVEDKAAVEAAREAYDALTDAEKAVFNKDLYAKLVAAEKQLAKVDTEYQKVAVAGTHMKIYSSAAKGYIKISWKATNSEVALDGVEVYRSTKKTSGFKKISTFKVQTSKKYTTGLKKGTKYYYYVKGYKMIGDEKVYTHQSITVARTFK